MTFLFSHDSNLTSTNVCLSVRHQYVEIAYKPMPDIHSSHLCQSSMPVIHASHLCQSSMPVIHAGRDPPHQTIPTKPSQTISNHIKQYHISSLYLQLSITAIFIHNATLPFSEDRDCKPFSACFIFT